jgi:hypothetical protein
VLGSGFGFVHLAAFFKSETLGSAMPLLAVSF